MSEPEIWMQHALSLARLGESVGEVPVGAVVVMNNEIIGEGWNQPISTNDPSAHAEIIALRSAAARLKNYRLTGADLYVTLEPCAMCAGAIIHARMTRVLFGARDPRTGAAGSVFDILGSGQLNHSVTVIPGIMDQECGTILREFFKNKR